MKSRIDEQALKELLTRNIEGLRAVNFNEEYIASVVSNLKKWAETGLLAGIADPYISKNVAILLENQRLWNERTDDFPQVKRISIPAVRRIFADNFIGYQLVSVQALKSNENSQNVYSTSFEGKTMQHTIETGVRPLPFGDMFFESYDGNRGWRFEQEIEDVAKFAEESANELGREIIRDLALNAGKAAVYEYQDENHLMSLIEGMSSYISAKCFRKEATWVVTSPAIVKLLESKIEFREELAEDRKGISYIGTLKKDNSSWNLYEDSEAVPGHILLGLKDPHNHFFAGYIFSPIITANPLKAESVEDKNKILSHYGKRLLNPNFYGIIEVKNLPEVSNLEETTEKSSEGEEE